MRWRLLIASIFAVLAQGEDLTAPSQFYIVSVFFSDGGGFYYRVIDVTQEGPDSVVQYTRVAPVNAYCPRMIVQSARARVPNTSPAQLVKRSNLCAVKPGALSATLKKYAGFEGVFEAVSFGIVTQCGSSSISLGLPISQRVNLKRMQRAHPEIARLWDLTSEIIDSVFGSKGLFHDRTEADDLILQRAGQSQVTELVLGRYDTGLAEAAKGNVGTWQSPTFRSLLASYQGPVTVAEVSSIPELLNAKEYRFSHFVAPKYPPLARSARIQGKVELQLTLEPATGEILDVLAVSGHPMLKPSAVDAGKQWRFMPHSVESNTLNLSLDFALCR
jgi:TonB family protein